VTKADHEERGYNPEAQKRTAVRVDVERLPVQVWLCHLQRCAAVPAVFVNLSGAGGLIEIDRALAVGLRLHCRFVLPRSPLSSVGSTVIRCTPLAAAAGPTPLFKLAVHFNFTLEGKRDLVVRWIFEEIARQRRISGGLETKKK
jgi:hypothetical protein